MTSQQYYYYYYPSQSTSFHNAYTSTNELHKSHTRSLNKPESQRENIPPVSTAAAADTNNNTNQSFYFIKNHLKNPSCTKYGEKMNMNNLNSNNTTNRLSCMDNSVYFNNRQSQHFPSSHRTCQCNLYNQPSQNSYAKSYGNLYNDEQKSSIKLMTNNNTNLNSSIISTGQPMKRSPLAVIAETSNANINRVLHTHPHIKTDLLEKMKHIENEREICEFIKHYFDRATLIIPPFLYLGGHCSVKNVEELRRMGVTHVLNMAQELELDSSLMAKYNIQLINIEAKDARDYNIRSDFDRAFYHIDLALKANGKIVVNCARGISRSATIVIAYLMFRFNMSFYEAYTLISKMRPHVRPNSSFRRQLETFEQELAYLKYMSELSLRQQHYSHQNNRASVVNNSSCHLNQPSAAHRGAYDFTINLDGGEETCQVTLSTGESAPNHTSKVDYDVLNYDTNRNEDEDDDDDLKQFDPPPRPARIAQQVS